MQPEYPFSGPKYGVGALERFHECLLNGASAKNAARSSHAFKKNEVKQQADTRPRRRGGYCIRLFCVWASRRQESPCSSLVRHRAAWNHQRTPSQQRLGAQMEDKKKKPRLGRALLTQKEQRFAVSMYCLRVQ